MRRGTETPLTPCQEKPHSNLSMSTEIHLTHVTCQEKPHSVLSTVCQQRLPLPNVKRIIILLCLQYANRDSPYPCQEKPHVYSMSTETPLPLIHVKRNLTLLCPCQQRLPLPMSTETSLCSAHVKRDSSCPYQKKPHSALTHVDGNFPQLCPCQQKLPYPYQRKQRLTLPISREQRLTLLCPACQPKT